MIVLPGEIKRECAQLMQFRSKFHSRIEQHLSQAPVVTAALLAQLAELARDRVCLVVKDSLCVSCSLGN